MYTGEGRRRSPTRIGDILDCEPVFANVAMGERNNVRHPVPLEFFSMGHVQGYLRRVQPYSSPCLGRPRFVELVCVNLPSRTDCTRYRMRE